MSPNGSQAHPPDPKPTAPGADIPVGAAAGQLAGRGVRLRAATIDSLIAACLAVPAILAAFRNWDPTGNPYGNFINGGLALTGLLVVGWLAITLVLVARNGQSIGKRLTGIKVVRTDGTPASLGRIFWLRNLVNGLLAIGVLAVLAWLLGGVSGSVGADLYNLLDTLLIFGAKRQCLHDRIAATLVVQA